MLKTASLIIIQFVPCTEVIARVPRSEGDMVLDQAELLMFQSLNAKSCVQS